jgi:hypothetical protein
MEVSVFRRNGGFGCQVSGFRVQEKEIQKLKCVGAKRQRGTPTP